MRRWAVHGPRSTGDQHQLAAEAGGDVADVDDAIRVGREAAAVTADHGPDR
ncbi:hypothetical protein ACFWOJ_12950 [Streptomyces sp. NPDC058439]|uniref:hypothetical protein n=1 Tax=Streptomyces sp. NPDC058439 TaxID=3346500 RepID=UPI003648FA7E